MSTIALPRVIARPDGRHSWPVVRYSASELLLATASLCAGAVMFVNGPLSFLFGLSSGVFLASEVLLRKASWPLVLAAMTSFTASVALAATDPAPLVGLLFIAAIVLPLHRAFFSTFVLSQLYLASYVLSFAIGASMAGLAPPWWQLVAHVLSFNVVAGVGYQLVARHRLIERVLAGERDHALDLGEALARADVMRHAIMGVRDELDGERLLQQFAIGAEALSHCDICQVVIPANRAGTLGLGSASDDIVVEPTRTRRHPGRKRPLLHEALSNAEPQWLAISHGDMRTQNDFLLSDELETLAAIPVIVKGTAEALLVLGWKQAFPAVLEERNLIAALVEQAGAALERAALRKELAARAEGAEALHRVAAGLAGRRDIAGMAEDALRALRKLYLADAACFYFSDREGVMEPMAVQGVESHVLHQIYALAEKRRGRSQEQQRTRSLLIQGSEEPGRSELGAAMRVGDIATFVDIPAPAGKRAGGILLCHQQPHAYRSFDLELLEIFARQLAGGLGLAQAYDTIERVDRQREDFLSLVSHELRQPSAAVALLAEGLASSAGIPESHRGALRRLRDQARTLTLLAEDVLAIAQMESGQFRLSRTEVDLGALITGLTQESSQPERVRVQIPSESLFVFGDPERIAQAFGNMLRNAFKYAGQESPVTVEVCRVDSDAVIEVHDRGIGFEPEESTRLYKKYGRISSGMGVSGVGLGLYLSRMLVEAHGGRVGASSPGRGKGATFRLSLPLLLASDQKAA